ncbi:MAG: serine/threonine-protein kinase, partial [Anaerolineales bacterium]
MARGLDTAHRVRGMAEASPKTHTLSKGEAVSDLIGKTLGSYQVLEQLGRGGMAVVYKAYQPSLDRYVAIKVLPTYEAHDQEFLTRFKREARAVAKLEHPNILAVHDSGHQEGVSYIVMRYVEAGTLKSFMGTALEMERIVTLIGQIADALHYAHENGVIHRDVKPSNVLLDRGDWPLLTDFGVARMLGAAEELTATGVGMGTPAYMSPEQGLGERVDRRSDVYSLGVVLFEMLTGDLPFEAETPLAIVLKHIHDPLPIPSQVNPSIPEAVERVVLKAMAKAPEDRFQTTAELKEALSEAVKEAEDTGTLDRYRTEAPMEAAAPESAPPTSQLRQLWWLAPAAAVLVVAAFLLGRGILGTSESSEEPIAEAIATSAVQTAPAEESVASVPPAGDHDFGVYDDFNDPAFDGALNPANWVDQSDPTCAVGQEQGGLRIANEASQEPAECRVSFPLDTFPSLPQIRLLEFDVWLSSDHSEELSEHNWSLEAVDIPQGVWHGLCGVAGRAEGAVAFIEVKNFDSDTFARNIQIPFDAWHNLRFEVDPGSLELACYVDGLLIGSTVPDAASELYGSETSVRLQAFRPPGSLATAYIDNVRIEIAPIGGEGLVLYDDFEDPAFQGSLNPDKWQSEIDEGCRTNQRDGALVVSNDQSDEACASQVYAPEWRQIQLEQIRVLEAPFATTAHHGDAAIEHNWKITAPDIEPDGWETWCGIQVDAEGPRAFFEVSGTSEGRFYRGIQISQETWHRIRLEFDPDSRQLSCLLGDQMIGSVIPDPFDALMQSPVHVSLRAWRSPNSYGTTMVDDVRF